MNHDQPSKHGGLCLRICSLGTGLQRPEINGAVPVTTPRLGRRRRVFGPVEMLDIVLKAGLRVHVYSVEAVHREVQLRQRVGQLVHPGIDGSLRNQYLLLKWMF